MVAPLVVAAGIGAAGALASSYMNSKSQAAAAEQMEEVAKINAKAQAEENRLNREYGMHLLNLSTPDLSSQELGDLLFSQNEGAYNEQFQEGLAQALRGNMRAGSPYSAQQISADWNAEAAKGRGDRRSQATLEGIKGVLPGAAALQTTAQLFQNPAPQQQITQPYGGSVAGNMIGGAAQLGLGLYDLYRNNQTTTTGLGNQATAGTGGGAYNGSTNPYTGLTGR